MTFEAILAQAGIEDRPFFRARDVQTIFGITPVTLTSWKHDGTLAYVTIQGRHYITRTSLKALCEKGN